MSALLYVFLGLSAALTFCFGVSFFLNRKAISAILQLQRDIKETRTNYEQAITSGTDVELSKVHAETFEIETRFKWVESLHRYSKLFLYLAISLMVICAIILVAAVIVGS